MGTANPERRDRKKLRHLQSKQHLTKDDLAKITQLETKIQFYDNISHIRSTNVSTPPESSDDDFLEAEFKKHNEYWKQENQRQKEQDIREKEEARIKREKEKADRKREKEARKREEEACELYSGLSDDSRVICGELAKKDYNIPEDIITFLKKSFCKKTHRSLYKKYHPDKNYGKEEYKILAQLIGSHYYLTSSKPTLSPV